MNRKGLSSMGFIIVVLSMGFIILFSILGSRALAGPRKSSRDSLRQSYDALCPGFTVDAGKDVVLCLRYNLTSDSLHWNQEDTQAVRQSTVELVWYVVGLSECAQCVKVVRSTDISSQ